MIVALQTNRVLKLGQPLIYRNQLIIKNNYQNQNIPIGNYRVTSFNNKHGHFLRKKIFSRLTIDIETKKLIEVLISSNIK